MLIHKLHKGMKKLTVKSVNYKRVKEVQQGQALLATLTLMNDLFQLAYSVVNNRDMAEKAECTWRNMWKDTLATFLVLTQKTGNLNNHKEYVMGVSGKRQGHTFLECILCKINGQLFLHSFLFVPDCPIPSMGRDFLTNGSLCFLRGKGTILITKWF